MSGAFRDQLGGLQALGRGIRCLAQVVAPMVGHYKSCVVTLGPREPVLTRDLSLVIRSLSSSDAVENMGIKLAREASLQTCQEVGVGAETTIVLIDALFSSGLRGILSGLDPLEIKQGMLCAEVQLQEQLHRRVMEASSDKLLQVAIATAHPYPRVGELVTHAIEAIGFDGAFIIKDSQGEHSLKLSSDFVLDVGFASTYFVTHPESMEVRYDRAYVLVCKRLTALTQALIRFLECIAQEENYPLVFFAKELDSQVLATLVVNKLKGGLPVCAVQLLCPDYDEILEDIALFTGATLLDDIRDGEELSLGVLGEAREIEISAHSTTFSLYGMEELVRKRTEQLQGQELRIARFGRRASIFTTQKDLFERVIRVAKLALQTGCVEGKGMALKVAAQELRLPTSLSQGAQFGFQSLVQAVEASFDLFCGYGVDEAQPFYDALLVVKTALKKAISTTCSLLTVALFVTKEPKTP